jgi:hypothetical protein
MVFVTDLCVDFTTFRVITTHNICRYSSITMLLHADKHYYILRNRTAPPLERLGTCDHYTNKI